MQEDDVLMGFLTFRQCARRLVVMMEIVVFECLSTPVPLIFLVRFMTPWIEWTASEWVSGVLSWNQILLKALWSWNKKPYIYHIRFFETRPSPISHIHSWTFCFFAILVGPFHSPIFSMTEFSPPSFRLLIWLLFIFNAAVQATPILLEHSSAHNLERAARGSGYVYISPSLLLLFLHSTWLPDPRKLINNSRPASSGKVGWIILGVVASVAVGVFLLNWMCRGKKEGG